MNFEAGRLAGSSCELASVTKSAYDDIRLVNCDCKCRAVYLTLSSEKKPTTKHLPKEVLA